jgi:glycosyltransferase involved in cell wall biosynthesis
MLISVVICTRNRAEQLKRVLATAAAMEVSKALEWEMLLVDNGSTDDTADVVSSFADRLPIRRFFEPLAGLSNARNRGVREARGAYLCWTDDDVMLDEHWLTAYASAFARHPNAAFFGGPIEPVFEGAPPAWLTDNRASLGFLLAERDFGPETVALTVEGNRLPFGANFAVRAAEQRMHLYDPQLGVAPSQKRLGEETAVLHAILRDGGRGVWVADARVRHIIPQTRQSLRYVRVYQQSSGETWAYLSRGGTNNFMEGSAPTLVRRTLGVPNWMWRKVLIHRVSYALYRYNGPSARWLRHWQEYSFLRGAIKHFLCNIMSAHRPS